MIVLACTTLAGFGLGSIMPLRWGVWAFLGAGLVLFVGMAAANASMGFAGSSIEESLLLFNDSWASYIGFNLQITYRAFAPPLLALAAPVIWRLSHA